MATKLAGGRLPLCEHRGVQYWEPCGRASLRRIVCLLELRVTSPSECRMCGGKADRGRESVRQKR